MQKRAAGPITQLRFVGQQNMSNFSEENRNISNKVTFLFCMRRERLDLTYYYVQHNSQQHKKENLLLEIF